MKRQPAIVLLCLPLLLLTSGCDRHTKARITLSVLGENASNLNAIADLKREYEKQRTDVSIEIHPNTFEDAFNKANQDFANKTGLYDIVLQYNFSLSSFVRNKYVYTLSELLDGIPESERAFESNIFPEVWQEIGYYYRDPANPSAGIERIAYPFAANTMLLVYNRELFESPQHQERYRKLYNEPLAVPVNWDQYFRIAQYFTQPENDLHGVCVQGATGSWLYYEWVNYLFSFGGSLMDKERGWQGDATTKITLTTPEAIAATKYFKSLKQFNAGTFFATDGVTQLNLMKTGRVAMSITWSDYSFALIHPKEDITDRRFGFTPIPGKKSLIAGGSFFINRQSKHPEEALKYIIYLMQKDTQVELLKRGLCSPLRSAYDDPEARDIPFAPALKASLERGVYMLEAGPDAEMISNRMTTYLQKIWKDELSVEDALKAAEAEITAERKRIFSKL